jgi:hypothetical protein
MPQVRSSSAVRTCICDVGSPTPYVLAAPDQAGIRSGRLTGGDIQADPTVEPPPPVTAAVVTASFAA